jgi:hypothetical protein
MDPFIATNAYIEEFRRDRVASARGVQFGTPSFSVVIIERVASGLRRLSAAVERWAAGTGEAAGPRPVSTH